MRQHGPTPSFSRPFATWPMEGSRPAEDARQYVSSTLSRLGADADSRQMTVRCTSELVANATEHARGPVWLSVWLSGDSLAIHVTDSAPGIAVTLPEWGPVRELTLEDLDSLPDEGVERGRGLRMIVQESFGRCGVAYTPKTKTVWFYVPAPWSRVQAPWCSPAPAVRTHSSILHPAPFPHVSHQR